MSEPSTHIPGDVADAQVDETAAEAPETPEKVELHLDQDKLEAWDDIKSDYQVEPGGTSVPDSSHAATSTVSSEGSADSDNSDASPGSDSPDSD